MKAVAFERVYPHCHPARLCEGRVNPHTIDPSEWIILFVGSPLSGSCAQLGNDGTTQGSFILWSGGSANSHKPLTANRDETRLPV